MGTDAPTPTGRYEFVAELWRWAARPDEWVFVRLPMELSRDIAAVPRLRAGFGAVKVAVVLGGSRWRTSIFPESAQGAYVLPLKRSVRMAEDLQVGDTARIRIELVDR